MWNLVGAKTERGDKVIFTHYNFEFFYNKNRVCFLEGVSHFRLLRLS